MPGAVSATTGTELSAREARRIALRAQGLLGPRIAKGPLGVLRHLGAVQIDTISVLARSHELVAYARLGPLPRRRIEQAYWGAGGDTGPIRPHSFEYWSHAACILPLEEWPQFSFKRAERRERGRRWHRLEDAEASCRAVLDKLRAEGPLTARELGGAKRGGPWWDWSEVKIAAEWLLDIGEVVCTSRRGFQRVYDLPERAVPDDLLGAEIERDEQLRHLMGRAATALGVATADDIAAYCGITSADATRLLPDLDLERVRIRSWGKPAVCDPSLLVSGTSGLRSRAVLLSPFDSTIWYRPRVERVFGFRHRLEAYVPRPKRVHGYFSMPVLVGDRLVGRVDPSRDGSTLVANSIHLEPGANIAADGRGIAAALAAAASWVGCCDVAVDRVYPAHARAPIEQALGKALRSHSSASLGSTAPLRPPTTTAAGPS